jgi:glucose/arabinose dehydrogenase
VLDRAGEPEGDDRVRRGRLAALAMTATVVLVAGLVWQSRRPEPDGGQAATQGKVGGSVAALPGGGTGPVTTAPPGPVRPPDQRALDTVTLRLEPVVEISHPTAIVQHPGTGDLYAASVEGEIVRVSPQGGGPATVADLGDRISTSGESGLLDIAFDATGDLLYISLVEPDGDLALVEAPVAAGAPAVERGRPLLTIPSPTDVHHAGDVEVDADGLVWFSVGDGGPSQGRSTRAQDLGDLHGKLLRIDPRPAAGMPYQIPPDNPFVGQPAVRPEIWAYGLRNPWRFHLDPGTGDLWIGDVGRSAAEEINHLPGPEAGAGANLGWPYVEGTTPGLDGAPPDLVAPVVAYPHDGRCGVTGGAVYRGGAIPALRGAYLYADLCDGVVRAVSVVDGAVTAERAFERATAGYPVSFGTDLSGEMYLCSFDLNAVFRIAPG